MKKYNDEYKSVKDYSILVRNLPVHFNEFDVQQYFENLIKCKVIKVNLVYDIGYYNSIKQNKIKLLK